MSIHSTGLGRGEKLVVSPAEARNMLDIGTTRLYELLKSDLESYKEGKTRKITVRSIHALIERRLVGEAS
jgi:hypothetical protein